MSRARGQFGRMRSIRESSPPLDDFYTGVSDINPDEALHSTLQQLDNTDRELAPHWRNRRQYSDDEGSASMSIELGRGVKRAGDDLDDISSNAIFTFGDNNSKYEVTGTPPFNNLASRKSSVNMRKEVIARKANEGAKRTVSQNVRVAPAPMRKPDLADELRSAAQVKNTRFLPKRAAVSKPAQGDTATSLALPDVSNIAELINLQQNDSISTKNPSRFTPKARYRMPVTFEGTDRLPVISVPIPEDEKKIYAALQTLQDKLTRLEHAHDVIKNQLEQCEDENNELRAALSREEQLRRPDSALGSEDESAKEKWRLERTKLQSTIQALQQRLDRSEQRSSKRDHELKASIKEKDSLVTQLGVECYRVEELESENAALRHDHELLRAEVEAMKLEWQKSHGNRTPAQAVHSHASVRSTRKLETPADHTHTKWLDIDFDLLDAQSRKNIASSVRQQFEQQRTRHSTLQQQPRSSMFDLDARPRQQKSAERTHSIHRFAPMLHDEQTNDEVYTEFELTKNTQNLTRRSAAALEDDMTNLTLNDPLQTKALRQMLEQERRAGHLKRQSMPVVDAAGAKDMKKPQRRSSLRDPQAAASEQSKNARNVRVQSPEADVEPTQQSTNMSLPIRSAVRPQIDDTEDEEGHTSAFIIPDITLQQRLLQPEVLDAAQLKDHSAANCTVCTPASIRSVSAPALQQVSSRTDLPEDATERPSQSPRLALAAVVKQLNDELEHLKLALMKYQKQHKDNEPAIGARDRQRLYDKINVLMVECKKKEDQIYALYDALEGQQEEAVEQVNVTAKDKTSRSTQSLHLGGFDGAYDGYSDGESVGLPVWEGLSDDEEAL